MYGKIKEHLQHELAEIKAAGLYKTERVIESPQRAEIEVAGRKVLNFCANNYLGLSDNPRLIEAAKKAMDARGFGHNIFSTNPSLQRIIEEKANTRRKTMP